MSTHRIRPGKLSDLPRLVEIYNHYVTHAHFTFDTQEFSPDQRRTWFDAFSNSGPHQLLVAKVDGKLVGYACSSRFKKKPAYSRSVETTIYMDVDFVGKGSGQDLYLSLLNALREEGSVHRAYGGVALPNDESVALHERLGFSHVGIYHEVGFKLGRYWDVAWYEKDVSS